MIFTYFHKAVSIQYIYITYRQFRIPVPFQPIIKLITHRYVTQGFSISEQEQWSWEVECLLLSFQMWPKISLRLAYVLTKACLEALLHLQHIKCLDSSNFVLYFVKHSFKPPRLSYNPWYRVCNGRSQIWDLISLSFQPRLSKYMLLKF